MHDEGEIEKDEEYESEKEMDNLDKAAAAVNARERINGVLDELDGASAEHATAALDALGAADFDNAKVEIAAAMETATGTSREKLGVAMSKVLYALGESGEGVAEYLKPTPQADPSQAPSHDDEPPQDGAELPK